MTSPEPLLHALQNFVGAETWEASRAVVDTEPQVLLSDDAQKALRQLADVARKTGDERIAALLEDHRELLQVCREEGVARAFASRTAAPGPTDELEEILDELDRPVRNADVPRRIDLCERALELVPREQDPARWGLLQAELAQNLLRNTLGERALHLDRAIEALHAAIDALQEAGMTLDRAQRENELGVAYSLRVRGEAEENRRLALAAYDRALEIFTAEGQPHARARTLNNKANTLLRLGAGKRVDNVEEAIDLLGHAVALLETQNAPGDLAQALTNQGLALAERTKGNREENVNAAIASYRRALEHLSPQQDPHEWAQAQTGLGIALQSSDRGNRADRIEEAIGAYEAALDVLPDSVDPLERARILNNLGNARQGRLRGDPAANVEQAIQDYLTALQTLTREVTPLEWAQTMANLGHAFRARMKDDRGANVEQAIEHYQAALTVLTPSSTPLEYAQVLKNLGTAYRERPAGDTQANLDMAMRAYERALEVRESAYGPTHPRVASVLRSISDLCRVQGDNERAARELGRAATIDAATPDGERELAEDLRRLADARRALGDHEGARKALADAIVVEEAVGGPTGSLVADDLRTLADLLRSSGEVARARTAGERSVAIEQSVHGSLHPRVTEALAGLADSQQRSGDYPAAEQTLKRALARDRALYGPNTQRVSRRLKQLGSVMRDAGNLAGALKAYRDAAKIDETIYGDDDHRSIALRTEIDSIEKTLAEPRPRDWRLPRIKGRGKRIGVPFSQATVRFTQKLSGYVAAGESEPEAGYRAARKARADTSLDLEMVVGNAAHFVRDAAAEAEVTGEFHCEALGGPLTVREGALKVTPVTADPNARTLVYRLPLDGPDGRRLSLLGRRRIVEHVAGESFEHTTSLRLQVLEHNGDDVAVVAAGRVHMSHLHFFEHLESFQAEGASEEKRRAAVDSIGSLLHGSLWESHAGVADAVAATPPRPRE
jgi:tetratricopeptide (TPR) repeat protein